MSSFEQRSCFSCGNPLDDRPCRYCTCERCGYYNRGVPCLGCNSETENSFTYEPTPYSYNDSPSFINPPPQLQTYSTELKFLKVKQAFEEDQNQPEIIQELLLQLIHDLQRLDEILPNQAEEKGINTQVQKKQEEKSIAELLAEEQAATINSLYQNHNPLQSFIYQDDDNNDNDYDEESTIPINEIISQLPLSIAITPILPIEEPEDSLIMEDEDINTIPEKELDEENESSVENLVHIPSESEATSDNESECDLPIFDDPPLDIFKHECVIFSRPLFDSYGDSTSSEYSSDNESVLEVDVFSNRPFKFDVESISSGMNPIYDEVLEDIDGTNYLIDSIIDFSPKIDPILEEFAGELTLINPIPQGIDEVDFCQEGDIRLIEKLSYDNSSPRPPEELNSEDIIEFFSAFPIPVEDSDFFLEKTETLPKLETFRFDIEEKKSLNTTIHADISLPEFESFHFDLSDYSLFLADKSESVSETFDDDSTKEVQVHMINVLPALPTLYLDLDFTLSYDFSGSDLVVSFPSGNRNKTFDPGISIKVQSKRFLSLNEFSVSLISDPLSLVLETLLSFSSENEDKVFNPRILVSKEEKSPHLLSHRGFKAFKSIHNFLNESPMMIYGGDIPIWDVPIAPDYEDSRARSFVQRSLELHPFCGNPISLILLTNV
ncbi:hypothetical protein Tco_0670057 [Tanacetum coccineum]